MKNPKPQNLKPIENLIPNPHPIPKMNPNTRDAKIYLTWCKFPSNLLFGGYYDIFLGSLFLLLGCVSLNYETQQIYLKTWVN